MDYAEEIKRLFQAVFDLQKKTSHIGQSSINQAIRNMGNAYSANPEWENCGTCNTTRYDNTGQTCAYLLKYAMVHTGLVLDVLQQALRIYSLKSFIDSKGILNVCSLGSGPGTDIVALMFFLQDNFGIKRCKASLMDQSQHWGTVFGSIISVLRSQSYSISKIVASNYFSFKYLQADLLKFNNNNSNVDENIRSADIITMIKFVSAAACRNTRDMVMNIFLAMKPGALLLFIDNAGGGFYEMLEDMAQILDFEPVFGPLKHYEYNEESFRIPYYGFTSQYNTKVTAVIWRKNGDINISNRRFEEIDYPVLEAHGAVIGQSIESDDINVWPQISRPVTAIQEENIRLEADSPPTKKDERPACCVIM